jgi:hypothetical protein
MRITLIIAFVYFSIVGQAQFNNTGFFDLDLLKNHGMAVSFPEEYNIVKAIYKRIENKNGKELVHVRKFNSDGKLVVLSNWAKPGEITPAYSLTYHNDKSLKSITYLKKNEVRQLQVFKLKDGGKLLSFKVSNAKGNQKQLIEWIYDRDGDLEKVKSYKNKSDKLDFCWSYLYAKNNSSPKAILYNGAGKVIDSFPSDTNNVFRRIERKQQYYLKYNEAEVFLKEYQFFDEEGQPISYIINFDKRDSLPVKAEGFNTEGVLVFFETYRKSFNKPIETILIADGDPYESTLRTYENGVISNTTKVTSGKMLWKEEYLYNYEDMLHEIKHTNKLGENDFTIRVAYLKEAAMEGLVNEESKYYNKQ